MSDAFTRLNRAPDPSAMLNGPHGGDPQSSLHERESVLGVEQEFWVQRLDVGDEAARAIADTFVDHTTLAIYSSYNFLDALITEADSDIGDTSVMARIQEHAIFTMAMSRMIRQVTQEGTEAPTEGVATTPQMLDTMIDIEAMEPRLGGLHVKNNVLLSIFGVEEPIVEMPFDIDGNEIEIPPESGIWLEGRDVFVQLRCPARPTSQQEENIRRDFNSPLWKADYTTARPYLKARFGQSSSSVWPYVTA